MGDARALTRSQRPGRVRGRRVRGWARRRGCTSAPPLASEPRGGFPATVPMSACEEQSSPGTPIWVLHELRVSALPEMIRGSWKGKGKLWVLAVWKQTWFIIRFSILCAPPPPAFFLEPCCLDRDRVGIECGPRLDWRRHLSLRDGRAP